MVAVLGCVTGCEHSAANYLPSYGVNVGGIAPGVMAAMTSLYWSMISVGRLAWATLSATISSGWPVLFLDCGAMLVAGGCFLLYYYLKATRPISLTLTPWQHAIIIITATNVRVRVLTLRFSFY